MPMRTPLHRPSPQSRRRGTAMLELVLVLPLLLLMMALMILVGATGSWRVRTHAAARQAALRSVWPRTTSGDSTPTEWPSRSTTLTVGSVSVPIFTQDPYAQHTAVRGPVYSPPGATTSVPVNTAMLDPQRGVIAGRATIDRAPAIWSRGGFRTRIARDFPVLGNEWEYTAPTMNFGGNQDRRGRPLYGIRFE